MREKQGIYMKGNQRERERVKDEAFNFIMNVCESKYEAGSTASVDTDVPPQGI